MNNKAKYILGFFIEISHSADGNIEHAHEHTLEIGMTVSDNTTRFMSFNDLEGVVKSILMRYNNAYLNDFPEFKADASVENIGEVIYEQVRQKLEENNMTIHEFTIAETPLRTYIITDCP